MEGDSYLFDILWVKRGKEFLGFVEFFFRRHCYFRIILDHGFDLESTSKVLGEVGGGFVYDNVDQWWPEKSAFLNWIEMFDFRKKFSTLWWKQIGGTFLTSWSCGPKQFWK